MFHPRCTLCRIERLSGTPPTRDLLGPRARALLAAGVLAASTGAPTGVALAETPEEAELEKLLEELDGIPLGSDEQTAIDAEASLPEQDPSGPATAPATRPAPTGPEQPADPLAPASPQEPIVQWQAPAAPHDPAPVGPGPPRQPVAHHGTPAAPAAPETQEREPERAKPARKREPRHPSAGASRSTMLAVLPGSAEPSSSSMAVAHPRPVEPPPAPAPAPAPPRPKLTPRYAVASPPQAPGDGHVVEPGQCLWSIAHDLLGGASSNARIARTVAELWRLNADAIGTGDPNLVMPGQRLRLPRA